jgi:MscS family membrane protein
MSSIMRRLNFSLLLSIALALCLVFANNAFGQQPTLKKIMEKTSKKEKTEEVKKKVKEESKKEKTLEAGKAKLLGPEDEYNRGVPRTSVEGFLEAAEKRNYKLAAEYLDFRQLPRWMRKFKESKLAHQLKIVIDPELLSIEPEGYKDDGLPPYRDLVGQIKTPEKTVNILLQRVPRKDGVFIWKFSNKTVAEIPHLYDYFGYGPFEEALSRFFPDVQIFHLQLYQWIAGLFFIALAYLVSVVLTWPALLIIRRKEVPYRDQFERLTTPIRFLITLILARNWLEYYISLSITAKAMMEAKTVLTIITVWLIIRLSGLVVVFLSDKFEKSGQKASKVLLRPMNNIFKILVIITAFILWMDNIGFDVTALLAGLGVGGIAVALAAQGLIKNIFGTVVILLDKPFQVGQRIKVKGYDGFVEEIGLRSTKLRLLNGHQATISNDQMEKAEIENVGRRPYIRSVTNIAIPYNTPLKKIEKALNIIKKILENHEGMDPERPPKVYFNEFNEASLNIIMIYWYQPPKYWDFLAFSENVNKQIMEEFEKEGIEFALPSQTTYLAQDKTKPLHIDINRDS